jgi:hypothetical protein
MNKFLNLLVIALLWTIALNAQEFSKADWVGEVPDGCTSITVGKMATIDGSVITSHTDDSHRTSSAIDIVPPMTHTKGTFTTMYRRVNDDS